jgi:folate-binding protein YgfZ
MPEAPALRAPERVDVDEYHALTQGVALVDRSRVGRLRVSGEDAVDLLERLSTNALTELQAGDGAATVLTSNKGRILDLLLVLRRDDHLLLLTGAENQGKVAEWIDFYAIVEDVAVRDATDETAMVTVTGPGSPLLVEQVTGQRTSEMGLYESRSATLDGVEVLVVRTDVIGLPGYDLVMPADGRSQVVDALLGASHDPAPAEVGTETFEAARVERGVPAFGHELTEDFNPLEAGLIDIISFTKGCYVGQEVVARLNTYKKVQKRLVGMRWDGEAGLEAGAKLTLDGKQVGVVTSVATSPRTGRGVGLGYVRLAHAREGVVLAGGSGGRETAVELVEPAVTP